MMPGTMEESKSYLSFLRPSSADTWLSDIAYMCLMSLPHSTSASMALIHPLVIEDASFLAEAFGGIHDQ
jgi:hypothetical protein